MNGRDATLETVRFSGMNVRDSRERGLRLLLFWPPLLLCTYLALVPNPDDIVIGLPDTFQHALAFAYLTFALWWVHYESSLGFEVIGWMVGYGILLELVQSFLPERSAEFRDVAIDAVGITVGYVGYRGYLMVRRMIEGSLGA